MVVKMIVFFILVERLIICEFEGLIFKLIFWKGFVEFFGIFVMVINDVGFYILRIRFLFLRIFENVLCENVNYFIFLFIILVKFKKKKIK